MNANEMIPRTVVEVEQKYLVDRRGKQGLYTGQLIQQTNEPHGSGKMEYTEECYEGQWAHGDWSGFGKLLNKETGDSFEGSFLDNMKHGLGVLTFGDGRKYDGTFQFDRIGKGKMISVDHSEYWGYWSDATMKPHGRGKLTFPDGSVYDGEFVHGIINGHGRMTYADGRWYLGEWCDGEKNGLGLEVLPDGKVFHEGTFWDGKPVQSSSFPTRRRSTGAELVYRTRSMGGTPALVGPIPRKHNSVDSIRISHMNQPGKAQE